MLKRTPPEVLQEQETGFRRVMRTFDPEVPGYVFWPIIFGVGVIFQKHRLRLCIRESSTASPFKAMDRRTPPAGQPNEHFPRVHQCRR